MKKYEVSFDDTRYSEKPVGNEIGKINNRLHTEKMEYDKLAYEVGEHGCTFSPAIYHGSRKEKNYIGQQLVGLDFDNGVTFSAVKEKADLYRLKILFAYKTFSATKAHEKFRVVFALRGMLTDSFTAKSVIAIFMKIFEDCDGACKDCSRMFFGGKGLLELADEPTELSCHDVILAFVTYMSDRYGAKHYTNEIYSFYQSHSIKYEKKHPIIEDGTFLSEAVKRSVSENVFHDTNSKKKRTVTRNFDWCVLYKRCRLYKDFVDGSEYYYYPELFHIATNIVNIEKGKKEFLRILNSDNNANCEAYHKRNWDTIVNMIIEMDYQPQGCHSCPYAAECFHAKNMILTAKPGSSTILQTMKKEYVPIAEAEEDLKRNFLQALYLEQDGIHIIRAQTGIGKTNLYLDYLLKNPNETFLIAVPTHKLKMEVYNNAIRKGIRNIAYTPEMPEFSPDVKRKIQHIYGIGAGAYIRPFLQTLCEDIPKNHPDYVNLIDYLHALSDLNAFTGHIITTHDRLLLQKKNSKLLEERTIIIDEDIMRTMLVTHTIENKDILWVISSHCFSEPVTKKLETILNTAGFQKYDYKENEKIKLTKELISALDNVDGNILDLAESCYVYNDGETTTFLKRRWLPCKKAIIMSATAQAEIYQMLTSSSVYEYSCKMAKYKGSLQLYTMSTFSRYAMKQDGIIEDLKKQVGADAVITFKDFEHLFHTNYHYGAIEGLNCLEGRNISVIGLPNVNDCVYILYGMAAGLDAEEYHMRPMRVQYHGYDFQINTFDNEKLRAIQLWMLESLLEQAVGRARLLRYFCTVKVFARFPIDQAMIE